MDAGTTMPPIAPAMGSAAWRGRQFAGERLSFDLQSDNEKEDRHERIVDPLMNGERQFVSAGGNGDRRRQKTMVRVRPPGIG